MMGVVPDAQRAGRITNESGASSPTAMHSCCRVHRELNLTQTRAGERYEPG